MDVSRAPAPFCRWRGFACTFVLALGLVACGGGESSFTPPPTTPPAAPPVSPPTTPPATPPAAAFSATFAASQVSITADTSSATLPEAEVGFTMTNLPSGGIWYRWNQTGAAVFDANMFISAPTTGQLQLVMRRPSQLGAGVHTSTVRVEFCADAACTSVLSGPHSIAVNLTVTGSPPPVTRVSWGFGSRIASHHPASQTTLVEKQLSFTVENLPAAGLWLRRVGVSDGIVTGAVISNVGFESNGTVAAGFLTVSIAPPATLGSGVMTGHVSFEACFDASCSSVVPGSQYELFVDLVIYADENFRHSRLTLKPANGATDVIWSPTSSSLYVASSIGFTSEARILQVNPSTAAVEHSLLLGNHMLGRLAITDDGSRLFVSSTPPTPGVPRADSVVRRLLMPSLTEEAAVPLDTSAGFANVLARGLVAVPGSNTSFMASLEAFSADEGIYVYDTARRPNGVPQVSVSFERGRYLSRGATSDVFYSLRRHPLPPYAGKVEKLRVDSAGVQVVSQFPVNTDTRAVRFGMGRLYMLDGKVLDAETGAQVGQLQVPATWTLHDMVVDAAHSRVFGIAQNDYILSFDANTFELLALAPLGVSQQRATFDHPVMTLWGSDGLAVVDGTNLVILSGAFFTTYDGSPTM
jgi:hypothetical protein